MELFTKIGFWLALFALVLLAGLTATSALGIPGSYKMLAVQSGSMEPVIKVGSLVIIKPTDDFQKGEIITFVDKNNPKNAITHRILEIKKEGRKLFFITKGDANDVPDKERVFPNQVMGRMIFAIPFLGYPVSFAKTPVGLILLIILPAVIIIYGELQTIKGELVNIKGKIKKSKS